MSVDVLNNILPHSEEAEEAILASMFLDEELIYDIIPKVHQEDFYNKQNGILFQTLVALNEEKKGIDLITVGERLRNDGNLEKVGGITRIAEVVNSTFQTLMVEDYIKIIRDKAVLRRLIQENRKIINQCYDESGDVDGILDQAEKNILSISQDREKDGLVPVGEIVDSALEKLERLANRSDDLTGVPSGFTDLDAITNGWQKSDFIIVAARPAMGKTAFCLNMAANAAIRNNLHVAIFSLEMSKEQLVQRLISSETELNQEYLRKGMIPQEEWGNLINAIAPLGSSSIYIDDTPAITVRELRAKARRLESEKGIDLIIIDYLQLMGGSGRSENRQQEVSEISRSLKALARELDVPVIALSQLSRTVEQQKEKKPSLSHLRESGSLEQDADIVLFIYRDEYYEEESEKQGSAEIIIAKHRNGATGSIELAFRKEITKFANLFVEK